ncbi:hypothetical protein [Actinacidiphila acididurans]|uniref:Uncharacterized protein n=1 Tax=Actinacidiphila acididurans TaxID=2784346 RepID=A0ABS2U3G7_9ACTN|nr:hypothetical protein [Actinacidiphila acididurans]MBM9509291.1 hypothetical protein [Actinacidiphila acididurans]
MANEVVTVCLPADAHQDLRAAIEEAMAPFDLNGRHEPCQGEWDSWWLGRPGEEFDVLPGHEDDPRLVRALVDARGEPRDWTAGQCDGGPRGLLDFKGMRTRAAQLAASLDPAQARHTPYGMRQPEWVIPTDNLLTLDGAWFYVTSEPRAPQQSLDFANTYLDGLAPDVMIVRLRIHG